MRVICPSISDFLEIEIQCVKPRCVGKGVYYPKAKKAFPLLSLCKTHLSTGVQKNVVASSSFKLEAKNIQGQILLPVLFWWVPLTPHLTPHISTLAASLSSLLATAHLFPLSNKSVLMDHDFKFGFISILLRPYYHLNGTNQAYV